MAPLTTSDKASPLYKRIKSQAKRKFDIYPSRYANIWLSREYKKRKRISRRKTRKHAAMKKSRKSSTKRRH